MINRPKFQGPRGSLLTLLALLNLFHNKTLMNMPIQNTAIFVGIFLADYKIVLQKHLATQKSCLWVCSFCSGPSLPYGEKERGLVVTEHD